MSTIKFAAKIKREDFRPNKDSSGSSVSVTSTVTEIPFVIHIAYEFFL